ncbi:MULTISPECIES: hypothetical protein [unclassified Variovorax]|uniref:hypothetical protein n=1 Tax=unclassified Variovorax TaxID=663243 RepID=UPI0013161A11|nr:MULTISPECIES: hypothetical protein [unclassified Variovorax]VTU42486.1 hypothetical protein H6P1_00203 [Variovorax sp. PBL-H6]VTU43898.1 hypothetical protein SRS16P1_00699 [Variovorax sp. SRS16]VTU43974.1 hypothetical protein E5P1_00692 [Variovorax sp. PBL-E5]
MPARFVSPGQAALALKSYFSRQGIELALCMAKEAVAVTRGHISWNSLMAASAPGTDESDEPTWCHHCEEPLEGKTGYCTDPRCPYHQWKQEVPYGRMVLQTTEQLEARYGPRRGQSVCLNEAESVARTESAGRLAAERTDGPDAKLWLVPPPQD